MALEGMNTKPSQEEMAEQMLSAYLAGTMDEDVREKFENFIPRNGLLQEMLIDAFAAQESTLSPEVCSRIDQLIRDNCWETRVRISRFGQGILQ